MNHEAHEEHEEDVGAQIISIICVNLRIISLRFLCYLLFKNLRFLTRSREAAKKKMLSHHSPLPIICGNLRSSADKKSLLSSVCSVFSVVKKSVACG
jgi:hypothetical protein